MRRNGRKGRSGKGATGGKAEVILMRNPATNLIAAFLICAGIFISSESANAGPRTKGLSQESRAAEIVGTSATIEAAGVPRLS